MHQPFPAFHSRRRRALAFVSLLAFSASAETSTEAPLVDVLHLAGPVYMLRANTPIANPSTVVSVGEDGVFVVDPNLEAAGEALETAIRELGGEVRLIASTHYHGDHTEGLERFTPPAVAIAPQLQRERLATGEVVLGERPVRPESLPTITFEGRIRVHFNGETIEIFTPRHAKGHTDGDAFVYFEDSGVLCAGDYLFLDKYPIVDLEGGGDLEGYLANIDDLLARFPDDTLVVPGHGTFSPAAIEVATMDRLAKHLALLRETIRIVRDRMLRGESLDEILATGLPERFAPIGERPRFVSEERWIRFVHDYYRIADSE